MTRQRLQYKDYLILAGNTLNYFDSALYGFLASAIGVAFFPHQSAVGQLMATYAIVFLEMFSRPLSIWFLAHSSRRYEPMQLLCFSLAGLAASTMIIGILPAYAAGGMASVGALIVLRLARGCFAAIETAVARVYLLQDKNSVLSLKASAYYNASSMCGLLLASLAATLVMASGSPQLYWRVAFMLGASPAWIAFLLRTQQKNLASNDGTTQKIALQHWTWGDLWRYKTAIFQVAALNGFAYLSYAFPFIFLNQFIPLLTEWTLAQMSLLNTVLLLFYIALTPWFAALTTYWPFKKIMSGAMITFMVVVVFLLLHIQELNWTILWTARFILMLCSLAYLAPLNHCFLEFCRYSSNPYAAIGLGMELSGGILGRTTPFFCLLLWRCTGQPLAPALYLFLITLMSFLVLNLFKK